jgi:uncharacterized protein (TIGR02271 family)
MANTVVGVFDHHSEAQKALNELLASGFSRSEVQLSPASDSPEARRAVLRDNERTSGQADQGWDIGSFFSSLFGTDQKDEHVDIYSEAIRRGSYLLSVDADSDVERDKAADIMNRYDPVDIDERASLWRTEGWTKYDNTAAPYEDTDIQRERTAYATGAAARSTTQGKEERIPVVEEQLSVGKREVQRGGVRVFKRLVEKPVQESVHLREEHVKVERRPVDQPASEAELAAFKEGEIELRETGEEAVVGKRARVVEEVVVGKEVSERTETINDTVRGTEVEVENLGTEARAAADTTGDSHYRTHWQSTYGNQGGKYEDYEPAYRHGNTLASNEKYTGYRWNDVEPEARRDWEARNTGTSWGNVEKAVRHGWESKSSR